MQAHAAVHVGSEEAQRKAIYKEGPELGRAALQQTIFEQLAISGRRGVLDLTPVRSSLPVV